MDLTKLREGIEFQPSDKQLLEDYLKPKIQGTLCSDVIKEKEIYGPHANPWEIFNDSSTHWITSGKQKIIYIFAHLTKIADKESSGEGSEVLHYVRRAGCGTWHVETGSTPVMDGDNVIGEKRMLVFEINDINGLTDGVKHCYCNMDEYFLKGYEDYVVCRIIFDTKKLPRVTSTKVVSGTRGSTIRSKANKKMTTTCTTKDERQKALLIESSSGFRDWEKEALNHDSRRVDSNYTIGGDCISYGLSYDNQRWHEENSGMMIHQNLLQASMNFDCHTGSDQRLILNKGLPQYDGAWGNCRVEEQEGRGLVEVNVNQTLNYEEEAQQVILMGGDSKNLGTVFSDFNFGSHHDQVDRDFDDLFDGQIWSDVGNVLMEQPLPNYDLSLEFQDTFDIDSWSLKDVEKFLGLDNNMQEPQQQQQLQQPIGDVDNIVLMEQPLPNYDLSLDFQDTFDIDSWSLKDIEKFLGLDNNVQEPRQQPIGNVLSCMLRKRVSFEAQEAGPSKKSRI